MARSNQCILDGKIISVDEAIEFRETRKETPIFLCIQCNNRVIPHKGSSYGEAHFEHQVRNSTCGLSDPGR